MSNGEYKDIYEYAYDMRLIWRNCCTYNQETAEIYSVGRKLSELFEGKFHEIEEMGRCLLGGMNSCLVPNDMRYGSDHWEHYV